MWESNHGEGHKNMNIIKWVIVWFLASAVPPPLMVITKRDTFFYISCFVGVQFFSFK